MVVTQPWRYGDLELGNLSKEQDYFAEGSSCSDVTRGVICFYRQSDGDRHGYRNDKGQSHKGEGSSLKVSSKLQTCEANGESRQAGYPPPRHRGRFLRSDGSRLPSLSR